MSKLLIVEDSIIVQGILNELLDGDVDFEYDLVSTHEEAKALLSKKRYEYAVVERILKDAPNGEIIALLNKHNIAPLVFISEMSEDFFDGFEGAKIVDYIKKIKFKNIPFMLEKLKQLKLNKQTTVLVFSASSVYSSYLKHALNLQNFKVLVALNEEEAHEKINLHPEISLFIVDADSDSIKLIERAREESKQKELRILVLVDELNSYTTSLLLNNGADDFLVKQFSREEFNVRIYQNLKTISID